MADRAPRPYLVCYDISDPRRLGRVHRLLQTRGIPLQYSVFLLWTDKAGLQEVMQRIEELINRRHDDVRAYPLPRQPRAMHLGRQLFPEGVALAGLGVQTELFPAGGI